MQAMPFEPVRERLDGGERELAPVVPVVTAHHTGECAINRRDVAMRAELAYQRTARLQRAVYIRQQTVVVRDPMEHRVREDHVPLPLIRQVEGVTHLEPQVGRVVLEEFGNDVKWRAVAKAAAGSDARMSGCSLPVIINSGSGNQGMTCSLPVIEYAKELGKSEDEMFRALCVSNLVALNQKKYIGSLSAYCGAVCAAAGAGAGITYLSGGNLEQIENTVVNAIANAGGIVCDGAKPSCAAKIATSLQAAVLSHKMAMRGLTFSRGEGLVMDCPEDTIKAVGYVGRAGMKQTDVEILNLMIGRTKLEEIETD